MRKSHYIAILIFGIVFTGFSQEKTESSIVISEENLTSLINKIKAKRIENLENQSKKDLALTSNLDSNYKIINTNSKSNVSNNAQLDAISSDVLKLQYEIKYLNALLLKNSNSPESREYIINNLAKKPLVVNDNKDEIYRLQKKLDSLLIVSRVSGNKQNLNTDKVNAISKDLNTTQDANVISNRELIYNIQKKLDSMQVVSKLKSEKSVIKSNPKLVNVPVVIPVSKKAVVENKDLIQDKNAEYEKLKVKYDSLMMQLALKNNSTNDTIVINHKVISDFNELRKLYGNYKEALFFDINSSTVKTSEKEKLKKLIEIINSSENIDVYLKGYASKTGNASLNQKLSLERTESIKQNLILNGIHPSRILSQFHGVDYESKTNENARRVDVSFIIRK
jgi:outer membrane protein OmpA-like peptidoglycan-associated protein